MMASKAPRATGPRLRSSSLDNPSDPGAFFSWSLLSSLTRVAMLNGVTLHTVCPRIPDRNAAPVGTA